MLRQGMEESYETFEEELGPPRANPPPQKSVRQSSRAEMYAARKIRQEMIPGPEEPRALGREPTLHTTGPLCKSMSNQNLIAMETPWENVTLNRCLFVAITILVLTSGFQRLHETLRRQGTTEEVEEVGLRARQSGTLRHRGKLPQTETSLWDVMFWWLPDLDDDDDDDDDRQVKRGCSLKRTAQRSRGLRNRPMLDKGLMKPKEGKLKDKRSKKAKDKVKDRKQGEKKKESEEAAENKDTNEGDDQNETDEVLKNSRSTERDKKKI